MRLYRPADLADYRGAPEARFRQHHRRCGGSTGYDLSFLLLSCMLVAGAVVGGWAVASTTVLVTARNAYKNASLRTTPAQPALRPIRIWSKR